MIDLRSDTVTQPTDQMRKAMAEAEVGDDGYGEDPTVRRLEERYAEIVGKAAAVFVPSGTMANQIALRLLGRPGSAVLVGRRQHPVAYEMGASGVNGAYQLHTIDDADGTLDPAEVAELIAGVEHHWLPVSAVCVENTHMPACGAVWPLDRLAAVAACGVPVHLDGARLFNASVASGVAPSAYAAHSATVMSCLSKGLGAPVGSVLAGSADLIDEARPPQAPRRRDAPGRDRGRRRPPRARPPRRAARRRPRPGTPPRRCGRRAVARRARPRRRGHQLRRVPPRRHPRLLAHLAATGIVAGTIGAGTVRFMTHLDIDDADVAAVVAAIRTA